MNINEILDELLVNRYEAPEKAISVTYVCRDCLRYAYYRTLTHEEKINYIAFIGSSIHHAIQEELNAHGYLIEFEVVKELRDGYKLFGIIDAISSDMCEIIEIKTVNKVPYFEPYMHHIHQVNTYANIIYELYGVEPSIKIWYFSRMKDEYREFTLSMNRIMYQEVISKALTLIDYLESNTIPEPNNTDKYTCMFCNAECEHKKEG